MVSTPRAALAAVMASLSVHSVASHTPTPGSLVELTTKPAITAAGRDSGWRGAASTVCQNHTEKAHAGKQASAMRSASAKPVRRNEGDDSLCIIYSVGLFMVDELQALSIAKPAEAGDNRSSTADTTHRRPGLREIFPLLDNAGNGQELHHFGRKYFLAKKFV